MRPSRAAVVGAAALGAWSGSAGAGEPIDELKAEVTALKARIAELEARGGDDRRTEQRAQ